MTTPLQARPVPDIVTPRAGPQGPGAHRVRPRLDESPACRAPTRSSPSAASAAPSRTSTATCSSTSRPASPSTRPATATRRRGRDPGPGRRAASTSAPSDFYLPIYAQAAAELARIAPMAGPTRAFIGNSGAEAVEAGLKLARYHTRRPNVVAFLGGLPRPHDGRREPDRVEGQVPRALRADAAGRLPRAVRQRRACDEIEQRVFKRLMPADEFAAVIVEPIQGEGGYVVPEDDFLPRLRELCDRHGILLIADEVQSGAGRTGKMWAIQHWDVEPDILLTAKGIGSGMPIGAMMARSERDDLGSRRPRLHLRRQPRRAGRAARDDRAARGRPDRERRRARRPGHGRRCDRSSSGSRASSATSAARA